MNWQQFKDYLENNVIETNDEGWSLKEEAIDKYLDETPTISRKNNLEKAIVNLILSLRATLNDLDGFHHLPTYDSNKTWSQLIPNNITLGEIKGKEELLDTNTYNLLGDIFKDWQEEEFDEHEEPNQEEEMIHDHINWWKFRDWLADNILNLEDEVSEEAITKYKVSNPNKLTSTLTNLIETTRYNGNNDYHQLPYFCSPSINLDGNENPQVKTWTQLFPNRSQTFFGSKTKREVIDEQTFTILAKMHSDFIRPYKLGEQLNEDNFLTKFMMEAMVHLNFNLIKQKGYDIFLINWLNEYNKLTDSEQANLTKQKAAAEKFISMINEESTNQQEQSSYWAKFKQYGTTIAWIGAGILLIIFAWGWIKSKTK